MLSVLFGLAAALVCCAGSARAQASTDRAHTLTTVLALPDSFAMMCRTPSAVVYGPVPSGSIVREFKFGRTVDGFPDFPREVTVAFDSVGEPRLLVDAVILGPPPHTTMVLMTRVAGDSVAGIYLEAKLDSVGFERFIALADSEGAVVAAAAMPAAQQRVLTAHERMQARRFALWLWERRCDGEA